MKKRILTVIVEIESNNNYSAQDIENALDFCWAGNGTYKVTEVRPTLAAPDAACTCPKSDTGSILYYSNTCPVPGHAAPVS